MNIKYLIFSALILIGTAMGQSWNTRYPANVRFIAGGYSDTRPFFSSLNAALNDVKPYATASNPYTFQLDCDTTFIADWDSVYNSGLNMSDSIYTYYVATGKIKWAGFDIDTSKGGKGGSSVLNFEDMAGATPNYSITRWDSSGSPLSVWQQQLSAAINKIDSLLNARTLFDAFGSPELSASGDSLYFIYPVFENFSFDSFYVYFDTVSYVRTTGERSITDDVHFRDGNIDFEGTGPIPGATLQLPGLSDGYHENPRGVWSDGSEIYFRSGGTTYILMRADSATGAIKAANAIDYTAFNSGIVDSLKMPFASMHGTETDTITISAGNWQTIKKFADVVSSEMTVGDSIVTNLEAGIYALTATVTIENTATNPLQYLGFFENDVLIDQSEQYADMTAVGTDATTLTIHAMVSLAATTDIKLKAKSTVGSGSMYIIRSAITNQRVW